ncbi:CitMHS family transporter [Hydrocarboniphaga sp.]|uniref:CitMHS family transporter n=1 Tax=Hydrocarboniphaga sp. TaxID=2033016 RepID=UPI002ABD0296|nr:CitMHS family transporter [Hydrocarboniphaga sp.]MDZ4080126.1 CitMHS family transporter [Hydrocarboniphaga sp.]
MLTALGFGMVATFMFLIMSKRLSPLTALILIPILFGLAAGFQAGLGDMMLDGIKKLAPTGVMLTFAILYFGIMIDAGLFDPIVSRILAVVKGDPLKVVMGTLILAAVVSLDGDGSTTYMITVSAMLPLYKRLGMNALALTGVTILAGGIMNLLPWGGPTARVAATLHLDAGELFVPMIPAMGVSLVALAVLAYFIGLSERRRIARVRLPQDSAYAQPDADESGAASTASDKARLRRPKNLWINALLTIALLAALIIGLLPLPVLFMIGFTLAVIINYPQLDLQRERVSFHAQNALPVVAMIFAAGVFTGILSGTGMVEAMSKSFLAVLPQAWGPYLAPITAIASVPFTFFMSNDAFYYGVLPIVADAARAYGISAAEIGRASLVGQTVHLLSPLVPSTYLLVGLAGVEFADHQRYTLKWALGIFVVMLIACLALGLFPFFSVAAAG